MSDEEQRGSAREAFDNALTLLREGETVLAARQLGELLGKNPKDVNALRLLAVMHADQGRDAKGIELLDRAVGIAPDFHDARFDLGRIQHKTGDHRAARQTVARLVEQAPRSNLGWQLFGEILFALGEDDAARAAQRRAIETDPFFDEIRRAIETATVDPRAAESIYREILKRDPNHVHALVALANIALENDVSDDAERLLAHAHAIAPSMSHVHRAIARLHMSRAEYDGAETAAVRATTLSPDLPDSWTTLGTVYAWGLKPDDAVAAFERSLAISANQPRVHLSLGHVKKTLGDRAGSVKAYRACIAAEPRLGEAWWSLADLKTYQFGDDEIEAMHSALATEIHERDRAALSFALGKAYEDRGQPKDSFEHYATGNAIRHRVETFNVERFEAQCERLRLTFTARELAKPTLPTPGPVPIFVVGLPRSGSTLVDQILASHSQVQGTMELPHVLRYVQEFDAAQSASHYPAIVTEMSADERQALGRRYLEETAPYHLGAPYFVDKMPNNFMHVGLLARILPDAIFIDTRRHPMACCFSIFKQHFARGQAFGYDLATVGKYYRAYVAVMAHWDAVLPGRVHRVVYETMVDDTEASIHRLLTHCDLPFEPGCLRFFETDRVVRTASAEQVRRPIYTDAKSQWEPFDPFLDPLRTALGSVLDSWST